MTHDHAEDAALCDAVLRSEQLGSVGLIGSAGKWARFQSKLGDEGHSAHAIGRITTPIGLPEITGKDPATIAVSVAAALLLTIERDRAAARQRAARGQKSAGSETTQEPEPAAGDSRAAGAWTG
jgi:xanthine dehydrogenase accessory factor